AAVAEGATIAGETAPAGTTDHSPAHERIQNRQRVEQVVVIDASLADATKWSGLAKVDASVLLLESNESLDAITDHLSALKGVRELHIISHGRDGQIHFGDRVIDQASLAREQSLLKTWKDALDPTAAIVLYGCEVAATSHGRDFVDKLADLTGASVSASDDRTGSVDLGGDTDLEYKTDSLETASLLSQSSAPWMTQTLGVVIYAAGSTTDELMELEINGQVVDTWFVRNTDADNGQFLPYFYNVDGVNVDDIRINFVNDLYEPGQGVDRNLRVDRIEVDGVTYQTEDDSVFSTGTWRSEDGVQPGFRQSEYLTNNGYFQFSSNGAGDPTDPGDGSSRIEIFARGSTGDEAMQLLIDGSVVETYLNVGTTDRTFVYNGPAGVTADRIRVQFIGAVYQPEVGYDQNLIVDAIAINGTRFESEDPSTFADGVFVPGQGITSGNLQTEFLAENGYFQYSGGGGSVDPDPPSGSTQIQFQTDNFEANEADGQVTLTVRRTGSLDGRSTVDYSVPGGFAVPIQDFTPVTGTLVFEAGQSQQTFSVPLTNDTVPEGTETFTVELTNVSGASFGLDRTTIVTVVDDDNAPNPPGSLNVNVPGGFNVRRIDGSANFAGPTGLKVADDGRVFVTEKFGRIYVVENGQRVNTPFLDLSSRVYAVGTSQGLAGFALDPNFQSNGHVYVLYTANEGGRRFGRLERYTVDSNNPNRIDPSSRRILIGNTVNDGFPDGGDIHLVGDLQFGTDGSLLISYGDAAANGDNVGVFNSQRLDNLAGKILRVNPENGQGYASNPFFTGNVNDNQSRVYAYGLRNPYRFAVDDDGSQNVNDGNPGTLYIGDVMSQSGEELNIARGGENFGWPYFQGNQRFLGNANPNDFTAPVEAYPRSDARTSIGGVVLSGEGWPGSYADNYLHADFSVGWIRAYARDANGNLSGRRNFATGAFGITDLEWDANSGQLYFVALNQAAGFRGELYAIDFNPSGVDGFSPTSVASGSDGSTFAVTALEEVYRRDGDRWTALPGSFRSISVRNASEVWAVDSFGQAARWDGSNWNSVSSPSLRDISVSSNGSVWGVGTDQSIWQRQGESWVSISGNLLDVEVAPDGSAWGVNRLGEIWRYAGGWSKVSGTLTDITVSADGTVWGVNAAAQVWRLGGGVWSQQPNIALRSIDAGTDSSVWGIATDGTVRRFDGTSWAVV
ncbi:MAG: DUF4347 domain-containing protein, partial [Planctomycetota bacterium]